MSHFNFYKEITNLCDLQSYYRAVCKDTATGMGLGNVCKDMVGKEICKGERMSNWERRPLR